MSLFNIVKISSGRFEMTNLIYSKNQVLEKIYVILDLRNKYVPVKSEVFQTLQSVEQFIYVGLDTQNGDKLEAYRINGISELSAFINAIEGYTTASPSKDMIASVLAGLMVPESILVVTPLCDDTSPNYMAVSVYQQPHDSSDIKVDAESDLYMHALSRKYLSPSVRPYGKLKVSPVDCDVTLYMRKVQAENQCLLIMNCIQAPTEFAKQYDAKHIEWRSGLVLGSYNSNGNVKAYSELPKFFENHFKSIAILYFIGGSDDMGLYSRIWTSEDLKLELLSYDAKAYRAEKLEEMLDRIRFMGYSDEDSRRHFGRYGSISHIKPKKFNKSKIYENTENKIVVLQRYLDSDVIEHMN